MGNLPELQQLKRIVMPCHADFSPYLPPSHHVPEPVVVCTLYSHLLQACMHFLACFGAHQPRHFAAFTSEHLCCLVKHAHLHSMIRTPVLLRAGLVEVQLVMQKVLVNYSCA